MVRAHPQGAPRGIKIDATDKSLPGRPVAGRDPGSPILIDNRDLRLIGLGWSGSNGIRMVTTFRGPRPRDGTIANSFRGRS
jgi:hypothetical protein